MIKRFKRSDPKICFLRTRMGKMSYSLVRSSRRRTIEISVAPSMEVNVAAPRYVSEREIRDFILEKSDWIAKRLQETQKARQFLQKKQYEHGNEFLFLGKKCALNVIEENIRRPKIAFAGEQWCIEVPKIYSAEEQRSLIKKILIKWYKDQAKEIFGSRVFHFSRIMGLEPLKIAVRTQKNIWGSCGYREKHISLNWQLVLAPMDVIEYVIVHELAHFKTPNHSQRFWKKVEEVLPDYTVRKKWLRANRLDMVLP